MADCKEPGFDQFCECYESFQEMPKKNSRRKRKAKKDKKQKKQKINVALETDGRIHKKKQNSRFNEVMKAKKVKKKEKNKNKELIQDLGNGCANEASSDFHPTAPWMKHMQTSAKKAVASIPQSPANLALVGVPDGLLPKRIPKTKKKVAFDLLSGHIAVKRPKVALPQLPQPRCKSLIQTKGVRNLKGLLEDTVTGQSKAQPQDNDNSQCTGDDINSQDLFITQKTFRASSLEGSSGETNEDGTPTTPLTPLQQDRQSHVLLAQMALHHDEHKIRHCGLQLSRLCENPQELVETNTLLREMTEDACTAQKDRKMASHSNMKVLRPVRVRPKENPFREQPTSIKLSEFLASNPPPRVPTADTSTQTENFFTHKLPSCQSFRKISSNSEELKPLDLSLPKRARAGPGRRLSFKTPTHEVRGETTGRHEQKPSPCAAQCKAETTPSPQSEPEPKSSGTTTSSEDNDPNWRSGKADLTQIRAVQMRLNESFYFKPKGDGRSPRPESPLMKLSQGKEKKRRKTH